MVFFLSISFTIVVVGKYLNWSMAIFPLVHSAAIRITAAAVVVLMTRKGKRKPYIFDFSRVCVFAFIRRSPIKVLL